MQAPALNNTDTPQSMLPTVQHLPITPYLSKYWHDMSPELVLPVEPCLQCFAVMLAIDPPLLLQSQVLLEVEQQVQGGHGATREEVASHPISLITYLTQ